jgi:hypothetical protein
MRMQVRNMRSEMKKGNMRVRPVRIGMRMALGIRLCMNQL